jgi:nitrogen fixation protein FixH
MSELLFRKCFSSNAEAVDDGIKQYVASLVGFAETVEQRSIKAEARANARHRASVKHDELMAKLRKQNNEAIAVKELTKEMVYPAKRRF